MDELRRHAAPLVDRWQRLARGQRIAMIAVLIASAVGFCFLLNRSSDNWQPIAEGREFSTSELTAIQSAWRQAGLKTFRRDARRLLVPSADMARYTAALPKSQRDDSDAGDERGPSIAKANLFTSHEQLEQIKDNDLRATLRRHLKAIPAIADADVIWARGKGRSAFASRSKVTATINVLPRDGHDLTPELAQSLRSAVAGMVPDLSAEDIVVLDQSTGLTVSDDSEQLIVEQRYRQQERLARQLESRIAAALAHIPNATVQAKLVERRTRQVNESLRDCETFDAQASGAASVPRFLAAVVTTGGLTPPRSPIHSQTLRDSNSNHGVTRRLSSAHIVAKPTIDWTTDAPGNLVEFSPLTTIDHDTPPLSETMDSASSCGWQITVQIPQTSFEAHVVQQSLSAEHRNQHFDELCDAEYARLRQLVRNLLPPDAALAELSIEPRAVNTAAIPLSTPFAAWPHVVCGFLAVLCFTAATRRRRAECVSPPDDRSTDRPSLNADSLGGQKPLAHEALDTIIATPTPIEPLTELARLQQLDPPTLADALRHERPQAIAVLLTRFSTRLASACLSRFTSNLQNDVIRRLKSLGEVQDELVAEIARSVCQRMTPATETITHEPINRIAHLLPETPTQKVFA